MSPPDDRFSRRDSFRSSDSPSWSVGDRVLAPWEPEYLYAGTVQRMDEGEAHIAFDDGDSGWVPLSELRPLRLEIDQLILCRKEMGPLFYPAVIADVSGETVHVTFDDGEDEWTTVAAVRIPRQPGPAASPTRIGSERAFVTRLQRGSRVLAPWENFFLYAATVTEVRDDEVHVQFDDGDAGWVDLAKVHPLQIPLGLTVSVRGSGRRYEVAEVVLVEGERVEVSLESGATRVVPVAAIRIPCVPAGPDARPTSIRGRSSGVWVWLVPILVLVGLATAALLLS